MKSRCWTPSQRPGRASEVKRHMEGSSSFSPRNEPTKKTPREEEGHRAAFTSFKMLLRTDSWTISSIENCDVYMTETFLCLILMVLC